MTNTGKQKISLLKAKMLKSKEFSNLKVNYFNDLDFVYKGSKYTISKPKYFDGVEWRVVKRPTHWSKEPILMGIINVDRYSIPTMGQIKESIKNKGVK